MNKTCSQCEVERDISYYYKTKRKDPSGQIYYQPMCKLCNYKKYNKQRAEYTREQVANKTDIYINGAKNALAKRYEITREEFDFCLNSSEECEICGVKSINKALSIDHDHETGLFRGMLCNKCNMAIGQLGDNIAGLKKALEYLEKEKDEKIYIKTK